jgi:hypothetical protein
MRLVKKKIGREKKHFTNNRNVRREEGDITVPADLRG